MDAEVTRVPVPVKAYATREELQQQRFERDGIYDRYEAMRNCKLCSIGIKTQDPNIEEGESETKTFINMYVDGVATMPEETLFANMAEYWNTYIYEEFKKLGYGIVSRMTPSDVELHFHFCDRSNPLPGLLTDVAVGDDLSDTLLRSSMLVEEYIAGNPTGRVQLTQNGIKYYIETRKWRQQSFALLSSTIMEMRCNRHRSHFLLPGATIRKKPMTPKDAKKLAVERGLTSGAAKRTSVAATRGDTRSY